MSADVDGNGKRTPCNHVVRGPFFRVTYGKQMKLVFTIASHQVENYREAMCRATRKQDTSNSLGVLQLRQHCKIAIHDCGLCNKSPGAKEKVRSLTWLRLSCQQKDMDSNVAFLLHGYSEPNNASISRLRETFC